MKKFLLLPVLYIAFSNALIGIEPSLQNTPVQKEEQAAPQETFLNQTLTAYQNGKYAQFLKESDENYQEAEKKWKHNDLLEERKNLSKRVIDKSSAKTDPLKEKFDSLQNAKNKELLEITQRYPSDKRAQEVRDMLFFSPTEEEKQSLDYLYSLTLKFKGDGLSPVENQLINIDIEFWLKNLALEIAFAQKKIDRKTFEERAFVLQLEKMCQMELACKGEVVDPKIASLVNTAATVFPKTNAAAATQKRLLALGQNKIAPETPAEKEMQQVAAKYHDKETALIEKERPNTP